MDIPVLVPNQLERSWVVAEVAVVVAAAAAVLVAAVVEDADVADEAESKVKISIIQKTTYGHVTYALQNE